MFLKDGVKETYVEDQIQIKQGGERFLLTALIAVTQKKRYIETGCALSYCQRYRYTKWGGYIYVLYTLQLFLMRAQLDYDES